MNPIAFSIGSFEIRFYSIFILIGVIIGYIMITREAKRFNMDEDKVFNMFFWTIIIGIIGARLYYVMFNWDYFGKNISEIWQIWQGGLAIHGGMIFGLITLALFCKKNNYQFLRVLDMCVVPLIIAQALGRWGNFFNSEAYGSITTYDHLKSLHIPGFIIKGMHINGSYYTPTFLYESVWCIAGFALLMILRNRKFVKCGQITGAYLLFYGIGRFFIEALRMDSLIFMGFKVAQIVSIIMIIVGTILLVRGFNKSKYEDLYNEYTGTK